MPIIITDRILKIGTIYTNTEKEAMIDGNRQRQTTGSFMVMREVTLEDYMNQEEVAKLSFDEQDFIREVKAPNSKFYEISLD